MKSIKNFFTSSVIARFITSILLFIALTNQKIGYYKFLRWVVVATAIYTAFIAFSKKESINLGVWIFGLIAILFNPIVPFYLGKNTWQIADLIVGIIFLVSIFLTKEK
ncbi:MAG: DUF6804 family protein [Ignavibacteriaceae bacterium]